MPLSEIPLRLEPYALPVEVVSLLDDADARINEFYRANLDTPVPAFVPSDFVLVYQALREIGERGLAPVSLFCDWGSGYGVTSCLAAMLEMDAIGIEIEPDLVREAERLGEDFELAVQFVEGSFVPPGMDFIAEECGESAWLRTDGTSAYEELELDPDDFGLIYCYPWPGEQRAIDRLFEEVAAVGTLLLTYHGLDGMRLQRKLAR